MHCTACHKGTLIPSFIDSLLRAHACDQCGGNWVLIEDFLSWREHSSQPVDVVDTQYQEEPQDSEKALLCPVTGALMTKFKVSAASTHRVDYSASVGGIWLDKGEWELLKQEGIASSLSTIVTRSWQVDIRKEETKNHFIDIYESKFGDENYAKIKAMREWLQAQPQKVDLRAYLLADDPYST